MSRKQPPRITSIKVGDRSQEKRGRETDFINFAAVGEKKGKDGRKGDGHSRKVGVDQPGWSKTEERQTGHFM